MKDPSATFPDLDLRPPRNLEESKRMLSMFIGMVFFIDEINQLMASGRYPTRTLKELAAERHDGQALYAVLIGDAEPGPFFASVQREYPRAYERIVEYFAELLRQRAEAEKAEGGGGPHTPGSGQGKPGGWVN